MSAQQLINRNVALSGVCVCVRPQTSGSLAPLFLEPCAFRVSSQGAHPTAGLTETLIPSTEPPPPSPAAHGYFGITMGSHRLQLIRTQTLPPPDLNTVSDDTVTGFLLLVVPTASLNQ